MRGGVVGHDAVAVPSARDASSSTSSLRSSSDVEPEPLVLERVHKLVGERELESAAAHPGVADHYQPLRRSS